MNDDKSNIKVKIFFHEIPIDGEFYTGETSTAILIKIDEERYKIKGQERLWKASKSIDYWV